MRLVCLRRTFDFEKLSRLPRWAVAACAVLAFLLLAGGTASAASFGTVVPLGGHTSDLALDEARGVVYVANFTANRVDVVSTATKKLQMSLNVGRQPSALALSPNGQYLVITHVTATNLGYDSLTVIDLNANTRRTFAFGSVPLGVAFTLDGKALIVTTDQYIQFDPATGISKVLGRIGATVTLPPQPTPTQPRQFIRASLSASGDGTRIWGVADTEDPSPEASKGFVLFHYSLQQGFNGGGISESYWTADPPEGPRVIATDRTGTFAMTGWGLFHQQFFEIGEWLQPAGLFQIGGYAMDAARGLAYGHVAQGSLTGSPTIPGSVSAGDSGPRLLVADLDNLTVREEIRLQENFSGRAVLDASGNTLYAVSQSGLMILPVGSLNSQHRVAAEQEDVLFRGNWCDRRTMKQDVMITNPGGGQTPFTLSTSMPGVMLSATSGVTPARITIAVDTYTYRNNNGTAEGFINIQSTSAVNVPPPIRVLVNNKEPDQRGTLFSVPGRLIDLQTDRARNRFYVTRQDKNQVLVFDSTNFRQTGVLRTATTPVSMAITPDNKYLIVGADNAQVANVYDLDTLKFVRWIVFPAGHYPRSIAASNRAILAVSRLAGEFEDCNTGTIDHIDIANGFASPLAAIGVWKNCVDPATALTSSASGAKILGAEPDGTVLLYDAQVDDFVAARQDFTALQGAYGAVSDDDFVVGGYIFNSSLVPTQVFNSNMGLTSGVLVSRDMAMRTTATSSGTNGLVEHVNIGDAGSSSAARLVEAPILPDANIVGRAFTRTLARTRDNNAYVLLSRSGLTVLPSNYDAALGSPAIASVVNAADFKAAVAPGGLISIFGTNMSPVNAATQTTPLPTLLGDSCLSINGQLVPLIFVSPNQINGQLPFTAGGNQSIILHTPSGVSNTFPFTVQGTAPSVFKVAVEGWGNDIPAVVRVANSEIVTLSNPVHFDDWLSIFVTGLGLVNPEVPTGAASPVDPLSSANVEPVVTLGGVKLPVGYAGLAPGNVGVYQINVKVPFKEVPTGMDVPLTITQGSYTTTVSVRVVN